MSKFEQDYYEQQEPPRPSLEDILGEQELVLPLEDLDYQPSNTEPASAEEEEIIIAFTPEALEVSHQKDAFRAHLGEVLKNLIGEPTVPAEKKKTKPVILGGPLFLAPWPKPEPQTELDLFPETGTTQKLF